MVKEKKDGRSNKCVMIIFIAVCAVMCLLPFAGMLWAQTTTTTENRELAELPALFEDGTLNTDYLSSLGTYFEDHFAYRNELISLNAELRAGLLGVSATDSVVVGTDGWLYYYGTLSDYCGWDVLSTRGADNIAFNLSLMQGYTQAYGADLIVTFAPNKNSLYSENMPYYYIQGSEKSLDILEEALVSYGIDYVDMYEIFAAEDEVLYYKRDTHWNTKGALLASVSILEELENNTAVEKLADLSYVITNDFTGDINSMLYPTTADPEEDYSYEAQLSWSFEEGESVEDSEITTSGEGEGTLLMYRDSFANNMIQFLADVYETAYFTKMVPYDLTLIGQYGADTVIIERAERHLSDLGTDPAIMPAPGAAPDVTLNYEDLSEETDILYLEADGDYTVAAGDLPEELWDEDAMIYVGLEKEDGTVSWYVPFHVTTDLGDYGFEAYFYPETFEGSVRVWLACTSGSEIICIGYADVLE